MKEKQKILRWIPILFGIYLTVSAVVIFTISAHIGLLLQFMFGAMLIAYGGFYDRVNKDKVKYVHAFVAVVSAVVFICSGALFVYGSMDKVEYDESVVIVLGSGLKGENVAPNLAKRLDKAVEYHEKNNNAMIIVSGGQGPFESIPESLAMKRYLMEKGVPEDLIIEENKSTSTYENFRFSFGILNERNMSTDSVIFITNKFHIFRAERIANSMGIEVMKLGADTVWYTIPMNYLRELLAVVKFVLTSIL